MSTPVFFKVDTYEDAKGRRILTRTQHLSFAQMAAGTQPHTEFHIVVPVPLPSNEHYPVPVRIDKPTIEEAVAYLDDPEFGVYANEVIRTAITKLREKLQDEARRQQLAGGGMTQLQ